MSFEQFMELSKGYTFEYAGLGGAVMYAGAEIHFGCLPEFKGRCVTRKDLTKYLKMILDKYGYVFTQVMNDNALGKKFVERLGFQKADVDKTYGYTSYFLVESRYVQ